MREKIYREITSISRSSFLDATSRNLVATISSQCQQDPYTKQMLALACFCVNILCTNKYNMQVGWCDMICKICSCKLPFVFGATSNLGQPSRPLLLLWSSPKAVRRCVSTSAEMPLTLRKLSDFDRALAVQELLRAWGRVQVKQGQNSYRKSFSQLLRIIPAAGCFVLGALVFFQGWLPECVCKQNYIRGIQRHVFQLSL